MRILTFTSLFPNATQPSFGVFVYQRVAHLARRPGNTVNVIAPVPYAPPWGGWRKFRQIPHKEFIGDLPVYHPRYPLVPKVSMPLHGLSMYLSCLRLARRLHEENNFDCIDAHYIYPDGLAGVLLGRHLGIPVFVSARGTDINVFPTFRLIRPQIRWTLKRAKGVISVCEALKDSMLKLGIPAEKIAVIGNGIDPVRFEPVDKKTARARLGLPPDNPIALSVGALIPLKGQRDLISAVCALRLRYPNLRLYIIGEGPLRQELTDLARQLTVGDRIFLLGGKPNDALKDWYSAADMSCLVSSREGWANVLLESLACGTPVLATRVGGAAEVVNSPELGILVEPNVPSITAGLERAFEKRWDRESLVRYARARTWDVVAQEVETLLKTQLAPHEGLLGNLNTLAGPSGVE